MVGSGVEHAMNGLMDFDYGGHFRQPKPPRMQTGGASYAGDVGAAPAPMPSPDGGPVGAPGGGLTPFQRFMQAAQQQATSGRFWDRHSGGGGGANLMALLGGGRGGHGGGRGPFGMRRRDQVTTNGMGDEGAPNLDVNEWWNSIMPRGDSSERAMHQWLRNVISR